MGTRQPEPVAQTPGLMQAVAQAESHVADAAFRHLERFLPTLLGLAAVLVLVEPLLRLTQQVPGDYGEGWNAYHALHWSQGLSLYPDPTSTFTNNYPPLSFLAVSWLGALAGDHIVAGRILAFLSFLLVVLAAYRIVLLLTRSAWCGLTAALWLTVFCGGFVRSRVGAADPQWLGHAFMTWALLLALAGEPKPRRLAGVMALMLAGGLVKHNLFALPLALTAWLAIAHRRLLLPWLLGGVLATLGAVLVCQLVFGPNFLPSLFAIEASRAFSVVKMLKFGTATLVLLSPTLLLAVLLIVRWPYEPGVLPLGLYVLTSLVLGVAFLGGEGAARNHILDLATASSIAAGVALGHLFRATGREPARTWFRRAVLLLLLVPPSVAMAGAAKRLVANPTLVAEWRNEAAGDIAALRAQPGPALCESLALCYWAGKPAGVDFFSTGQRLASGALSVEDFLASIREHRYGAVQLEWARLGGRTDDATVRSYRVPDTVNAQWLAYYRPLRRTGWGIVLVPKPERGREDRVTDTDRGTRGANYDSGRPRWRVGAELPPVGERLQSPYDPEAHYNTTHPLEVGQ
jgi:hypothetical protein